VFTNVVIFCHISKSTPPATPDTPDVVAVIAFVAVTCFFFSLLFFQEVVEVTKGVWVAIGFGLANSIMVEGDSGVIIGVYCDLLVSLSVCSSQLPLHFSPASLHPFSLLHRASGLHGECNGCY
jgi:hypothetical protein